MITAVLMATYHGEKHLVEQLDSIVSQATRDLVLYVRDDDNSARLEDTLSSRCSRLKYVNLTNYPNKIGSVHNFGFLSSYAYSQGESYFCYSDQDDVWVPEKVRSLNRRIKYHEQCKSNKAVLLYSDMFVVDDGLNVISPSFMKYQGLIHNSVAPLNSLLAQNFVTGCASMLNRELMRVSLPFPKEAIVHDWWVALCAAAMGHIEYIDEPLVKYRQHDNNQIGASHWSSRLNPLKSNWRQQWLSGRDNLKASMLQARALAERVKLHYPNNENIPLIEAYADLINVKSGVERVRRARALGVRVQTPLRYGLFLSRLLFLNGK